MQIELLVHTDRRTDTRTHARTRPKHSDLSALRGPPQPPTGSPGHHQPLAFLEGSLQPSRALGCHPSSSTWLERSSEHGSALHHASRAAGLTVFQEQGQVFGGEEVLHLGAPEACWSSGFQSCYSLEAPPHDSLGPPISSNLPTSPSSFPMSCLGALVGSASVFLLERQRLA